MYTILQCEKIKDKEGYKEVSYIEVCTVDSLARAIEVKEQLSKRYTHKKYVIRLENNWIVY